MQTPSLQSLGAVADTGLSVDFDWRGDRYRHIIAYRDFTGSIRPLLESVEGDAADDWPPSPPLQNLTIEQLAPNKRAALLVGMAGRSHWSASVEASSAGGELVFDLACRHGPQPGPLGSRYRWLLAASERPALAIAAEPGCLVEANDELRIEPAKCSLSTTTARWRLILRLDRQPDLK